MVEKKLNPYEKKEKVLKRKLLSVARSIAIIGLPPEQVADDKAHKYFDVLEKNVKNFSNIFGFGSDEIVFKALQKVIDSKLITTIFIRNLCFAKTYRYLSKLQQVLENCSDLKDEIIRKTIDISNIDVLIETFRGYTRDLPSEDQRYDYIKDNKAKNLGVLYQTWVDSELFTALFEFHRATTHTKVKDLLLKKIKLEINESINKEDYTLTERIKDQGNLFWALSTVLLDNPDNLKIKDVIQNIDDFKKLILIHIKRDNIRYPSLVDLRNENTIEIQGRYRTKLYSMQSLINIYDYFMELKDKNKHKKFLNKLADHIKPNTKRLLLSRECERNSKNLYYLCLQLETIYKFMKMKKPEETRPKTIKKKMLNRKEGESPESGGKKLEYTIFLSRPSGIMVIKKEDTEEGTQKKYLEKKEKYDIFVYEETAYKKMIYGEKNNMLIVNLDKNILNLLILFLKYKNNRIPYEKLYHKAWEGSIEHDKKARLSEDAIVMNRLKTAVATLRSKFKHIEGFRMPHARSGGYICEGNFKFCVVLKNSTNQFYTLEGV